MMKAGRIGKELSLSVDGVVITELNEKRSGFNLGGQDYVIRRQGHIEPRYEVWLGEELLVVSKQAALRSRQTITIGAQTWLWRPEDWGERKYGLFDGDTRLGGLKPRVWFNPTKDVTIDLPDILMLPAQVFLVWLVLLKWTAD